MYKFKTHLLAALGFIGLAITFIFNGGFASGSAAQEPARSAPARASAAAKKPKGCFTCDFGLPGT